MIISKLLKLIMKDEENVCKAFVVVQNKRM